jgi:hypothetical protein
VDGTDFYMFRSYEPAREGFVTLITTATRKKTSRSSFGSKIPCRVSPCPWVREETCAWSQCR